MRSLQLYGWKDNFGDALNYWLWPRFYPGQTDGNDALLLGIGTVLSTDVPAEPPRKFVLGAGAGNSPLPPVDDRWTFLAVRGPRTAAKLGLPAATAVTDSALLIRAFIEPAAERPHTVSFMPHIISAYSEEWKPIADALGFHYIDPRSSLESVMEDIRGSELVLTEAMHGAIVADAFRVPWIRVQSGERHAPTSKWIDWTESLNLAHRSHNIPFLWQRPPAERQSFRAIGARLLGRERLRWIRRTATPQLSSDADCTRALTRLMEQVDVLKRWLSD